MLVDFTVGNFRSFDAPQRLSLAVGRDLKDPTGRLRSAGSGHPAAPNLALATCIFGPNACGKSNLVRAMYFFRWFVASSAKDRQQGEPIEVTPFLLGAVGEAAPTELAAAFVHEGILYQYGFTADRARVHEEWLYVTEPAARSRTAEVFRRAIDPESGQTKYRFNAKRLKGARERWAAETRDNALFLSTAVMRNSESLSPPFAWITRSLRPLPAAEALPLAVTADRCLDPARRGSVLAFLNALDLSFQDVEVEKRPFSRKDLPPDLPDAMADDICSQLSSAVLHSVSTIHTTSDGRRRVFSLDDESDGTRVLFQLAGPLLDVLERGLTLVVDELHRSLHPHALKHLIQLFHNTDYNKHNAQLVFTSHDTSILARGFLHRDQIWLMDKGARQASLLVPASDFKVREFEAFQKMYLEGRLGAVPRLQDICHVGQQ